MAIEVQCFEYLKSVNPIAQKIAEDIENIRESHKGHWESLDHKAKDKLVDETLIDDNLVHKYERKTDEDFEQSYGPISTFSWFTRSQLNLFTSINVKPDKNRTPLKKNDILSPLKKTKTAPAPKGPDSTHKTHKARLSKDERHLDKISSKSVAKPKTPPPPPPSKLVAAEQKGLLDENQGQIDENIPKTGFDFLDNW